MTDVSWLPCRYRLIRKLGAGATGEVWEAAVEGKVVALKILKSGRDVHLDILREHQAVRNLSHPNIVRFHGFHRHEKGGAFIEMERVTGNNLAKLAAESGGFLSWSVLKPLALQLCDALSHAHQKGVIHRDIKPTNLLVTHSTTLKVIDFGCAVMSFQSDPEITDTIDMISSGTLPFMSPQLINAEPPNTADDIYAAGATLHALLVGAPPFSQGHLVRQILQAKPPSIVKHQLERGVTNPVPAGVVRIVAACLAKDASLRPPSATVLRAMLEREHQEEESRRKAILTLAGCGLGMAFGGGFLIARNSARPPPLESGFKLIFDGKTLAGWHGAKNIWQVAEGAITARLNGRRMADASTWRKHFLDWMGRAPDDFELRLQVRLNLPELDAGNLGIRYRIGKSAIPLSYDLDFEPIWKYNCGLRELGGRGMLARPSQIVRYRDDPGRKGPELLGHLADEERLKRSYRNHAWNDLTIRAEGNRLVHKLNDMTIVDCTDDDRAARRLSGGIGLKVLLHYGPWVEARFRHIRLRAI